MKYEEMRQMEKTHVCAQCESPLVTAYDSDLLIHGLVCARDRSHEGYRQILSPSQALARGEADKHMGKEAQTNLEKLAAAGAPAVSRLHDKDLATGEGIARDKLLALVEWATKLVLKPYLGHVCLYFSNPYVTVDGYYYLNSKRDKPFIIGTRPASDEDYQRYKVPEEAYFFIAEAWREGEKLEIKGLGIVTKDEIEAKSERHPEQFRAPVVHGHPQRMAEKRAEWQLLRKLIPLEEQE